MRCGGHYRHWFTVYGEVGNASTTCLRCGAPNPRYSDGPTQAELDALRRQLAKLPPNREPKVEIGGTHWQPTHWIDREPVDVSREIEAERLLQG